MWYWSLTSYMTITIGIFRVEFQNSCIPEIVVKRKGSELIKYWFDSTTLLFDHTHDFDLVKVSNGLIWWMGRSIDMGRNGWEWSIHYYYVDHCVIMVGWVDVPVTDRVTSDVGAPSTYLAYQFAMNPHCNAMISHKAITSCGYRCHV